MIKVLFFGQLRELLNCNQLSVNITQEKTVDDLLKRLIENHPQWLTHLQATQVLSAVNQTLVDGKHPIEDNDEVAFFPPVTGG